MAKRNSQLTGNEADGVIQGALGSEQSVVASEKWERYQQMPDGFIAYAEDMLHWENKKLNRFEPVRFKDWQRAQMVKVFATKPGNIHAYLIAVISWARRHGKTACSALYDVYRCDVFRNQLILMVSNSAEQTESTAYQAAVDVVTHSPHLKEKLAAGRIRIIGGKIVWEDTGSRIEAIPTREASAYGRGVSVAHVTEACQAPDDSLYQVLASSTGDMWNGIVIVDSNVGDESNIVYQLIELAESGEDPTIGVSYIHYQDIAECLSRGLTPWLAEAWLRSRKAQMLPGEFRRNHLNLPSSGASRLFMDEQIARVFDTDLAVPVAPDVFTRRAATRYVPNTTTVAGGLDRALSFSRSGDRTIWTCVSKGLLKPQLLSEEETRERPVVNEFGTIEGYEEPDAFEYTVLEQDEIRFGLAGTIKKAIEHCNKTYGKLANVGLETYQTGDIMQWCADHNIPSEIVHASRPVQFSMFSLLYQIMESGRLCGGGNLDLLGAELANFQMDESTQPPSFGGKKRTVQIEIGGKKAKLKIKDDSVYSLALAIYSLREITRLARSRAYPNKPAGW